ncbi:hypothetical protein DE146DRAFT_509949 [Phaeosphaeria sp. MPI-PUGE-AT-0046c]|nr:hypothetical protein DE146DRAFT_509949 [Phaeosphaeria sp. MPI-PUGE-AT-0046c]
MFVLRSKPDGRELPLSLCHILCLCVTWAQSSHAWPQTPSFDNTVHILEGIGLIPSAPRSALIPSTPVQSMVNPAAPVASDPAHFAPIPSQPSQPRSSSPGLIPSAPVPTQTNSFPLIPSAPTVGFPPIPSASPPPNASISTDSTRLGTTGTLVMTSTDQGLRPIPPAATQIGDPNGHHEITEPNFSATKPCRACSPVFEVTATGWLDSPAEEQHGTSLQVIPTRVPAGPSNVLISQAPSGGNFVIGGSATVAPGQTITVNDVPLAVHTNAGVVEVIVGTNTIPLQPNTVQPDNKPRVTYPPTMLAPMLTVGTETIAPNAQTQYVVSGQTLSPGGGAIIVAGTTISMMPSATAVVINGATSVLNPNFGNIWTKTAPALTFNNHVYTANRAGYITISPGIVLKPGGEEIIVDGTRLSLDHGGTAVVIQGSTSLMMPVTTVVTLTRSFAPGGAGNGNAGYTSGNTWSSPTDKPDIPAKPVSAGITLSTGLTKRDGGLAGFLLCLWWAVGFMATRR